MADLTGLTELVAGDLMTPGGLIKEYEAEAAITKGQVVYLSSDGKISPATAATHVPIGIALKSVAVGVMCPVAGPGCRVKVAVGGAISRGVGVTNEAASTARVIAQTMPGTYVAADVMTAINRIFAFAEQTCTTAADLISILMAK